jgi:hypothetical protein
LLSPLLSAGAAFDLLHLSLHHLLIILTVMAVGMAGGWTLYAYLANRSSSQHGRGAGGGGYLPVRQQDSDET